MKQILETMENAVEDLELIPQDLVHFIVDEPYWFFTNLDAESYNLLLKEMVEWKDAFVPGDSE